MYMCIYEDIFINIKMLSFVIFTANAFLSPASRQSHSSRTLGLKMSFENEIGILPPVGFFGKKIYFAKMHFNICVYSYVFIQRYE
jgi:hypothetical protein